MYGRVTCVYLVMVGVFGGTGSRKNPLGVPIWSEGLTRSADDSSPLQWRRSQTRWRYEYSISVSLKQTPRLFTRVGYL